MTADLTFENTDKVFPAIQYQNGWVWVDDKHFIKMVNSDHVFYKGKIYSDGNLPPVQSSYNYIIAQTPDLNLEGVPVVEVEEEFYIYKLANKWLDSISETKRGNKLVGFIEGYKAAQSKGCYTEEQVREAIELTKESLVVMSYGGTVFAKSEQILQSIRPKIVVMTTCINNGDRLNCANETCWDLNECQHSPVKPITEIKNGRTYFKLKNTYERS